MRNPANILMVRRELGSLLALAIPVILSELGWITMGIVDIIMVGRLGPEAIGAVGISSASYYAPALFGIGILLGLDTVVSQAWGRHDFHVCHQWLAQGVYLVAVYTPIAMAGIACVPLFFHRMGINPAVAGDAAAYLRILNLGTLPLLIYAAFRRYLQGVGRVRPVTFTLISANLINWGGNWALIYGHLGLPAMGLKGSAVSTCLARVYMAGVLVFFAWQHERRRGHPLFAHWPGPHWQQLRALMALGAPAAGQIVMEVGAFGVATLMAGRLTADALAAHQIVLNCASATYMVPLGMSAAAAVSVGHAVGAADLNRARRAGWLALACAAGFMALAAGGFLLLPHPLLHIYTYDATVVGVGTRLLVLAAAFQIFDGIQTVATGALRGVGETQQPMLVNLGGYWLFGLPLGYALCFHGRFGIFGIWIGLTISLIVIALYLLWQWANPQRWLALRRSLAAGQRVGT
ncbi:MAG TPA: MATE family efflux transporter [Acidobacteriaceae bacterium]